MESLMSGAAKTFLSASRSLALVCLVSLDPYLSLCLAQTSSSISRPLLALAASHGISTDGHDRRVRVIPILS